MPPHHQPTGREATGAEAILTLASQHGVDVVFANPGTTEMWLVGALDAVPTIRPVLCLAETVVTGAADGYGRMARKPAVTILHLGPGFANGLANLHNARRASTPVVNIVGDMASWHVEADPLLAMDIKGLSNTVARETFKPRSLVEALEAVRASLSPASKPGVSESQISTIILPHDISWEASAGVASSPPPVVRAPSIDPDMRDFMKSCATAMESSRGRAIALYLGGEALLEPSLTIAGKICASTGAQLICENAFARIDRGAGLPNPLRLPYFPQEAQTELSKYSMIVTVGTRIPVAMFGYRNGPSKLIDLSEDNVWELDDTQPELALAMLGEELGGIDRVVPLKNCGGVFCPSSRSAVPKEGKLNGRSMCQVVAALQPADVIVVDESLTSGGSYWDQSKGCPPFSHLTLTGGAIGSGIPMSIGAAMACPNRRVINIQADGSGMYSLQGLWTQAREKLNITTIICANSAYAILKVEMARQSVPSCSWQSKSLMDLSQPVLDWTAMAAGMGVSASRATTVLELAEQLRRSLDTPGPTLIEAVLI